MTIRKTGLKQDLDVVGSLHQSGSLNVQDEPLKLGAPIAGQTGISASIIVGAAVTVSGLSGMSSVSIGRYLTISGATNPNNNGTFLIVAVNSGTSVNITNPLGATDANNGFISWTERKPYTLEDDLNYIRSDRSLIKGTGFDSPIPTYVRPTATGTQVDANLANIADKTTDARSFVVERVFHNSAVSPGNTFITISSVGNLKHADSVNTTGIPINDGYDVNNETATYVVIIDPSTERSMEVIGGAHVGKRIFGRTRAGSSTSPDSVEIEFRAAIKGDPPASSVAYTWESGQPINIDLYYGFRERLDNLGDNAFRALVANGVIAAPGTGGGGGGITAGQHENLDTLVHNLSENAYMEVIRNSQGQTTDIIYWTDVTKTTRIRDEAITRGTSGCVDQAVERQYNASGAVVVTLTKYINRGTNGRIISADIVES